MNINVSPRLLPSLKSPIKSLSGLAMSIWGKQTAAVSSSSAANDAKGSIDLCKTSLLSVIESQIIPRLLDAHPSASSSILEQVQGEQVAASEQDVLDFAQACLDTDPQAVFNHLDVLRDKGLGTQTVFLDVITPAARYLGDLWEQDKMDFTLVAQGLLRMHHAMRHLGYETQDGPQTAGDVRRIMLASAPGSQHILGLAMVSEFFRADHWQVVVEISTSEQALLHTVAHEWFDVIGLSVGLVEQLPAIPALIAKLKSASRNPNAFVILGGPALLQTQMDGVALAADAISVNAAEAVKLAGELLINR
jgi:MerR family transcriptional regulator, light-induced transcriptional regulator